MQRTKRFLKENWGAPFVVGFISLLLCSAAELSLGSSALASQLSVYEFYLLAVGVALQIGAYVNYAEVREVEVITHPASPSRFTRRQKLFAVATVCLVAGTAGLGYYFYSLPRVITTPVVVTKVTTTVTNGFTVSLTSTSTTTITNTMSQHQSYPHLTVTAGPLQLLQEPSDEVLIVFAVNVQGGKPPYSCIADWGDGVVQNNPGGVFQRLFTNQTIPAFAKVTVVSSDGQTSNLTIEIPGS